MALADPFLLALIGEAVLAVMLVCLGLIVFVPFFPGVAVIFAAVLARVGYMSYLAQGLDGISPLDLGLVVLFGLAGSFSSFLAEKLQLRFTYASQLVVWGSMICSMVFGYVLGGMMWFSAGLLVGAIAMEMREGRSFKDAARDGTSAVYSMLGPRGLQLLLALILIEVGSPSTLRAFGLLNH